MRYAVSVLFILAAFAWPSSALAECSTETIFTGSKTVICQTCCNEWSGQCYTNCF